MGGIICSFQVCLSCWQAQITEWAMFGSWSYFSLINLSCFAYVVNLEVTVRNVRTLVFLIPNEKSHIFWGSYKTWNNSLLFLKFKIKNDNQTVIIVFPASTKWAAFGLPRGLPRVDVVGDWVRCSNDESGTEREPAGSHRCSRQTQTASRRNEDPAGNRFRSSGKFFICSHLFMNSMAWLTKIIFKTSFLYFKFLTSWNWLYF